MVSQMSVVSWTVWKIYGNLQAKITYSRNIVMHRDLAPYICLFLVRAEPLKTSLPPENTFANSLHLYPCESLFAIPCAINPIWKLCAKVLTFAGVAQQMGWAMPADLFVYEKNHWTNMRFEQTNMTGTDDSASSLVWRQWPFIRPF